MSRKNSARSAIGFWYENGAGTIVFDFKGQISGYASRRLQIAAQIRSEGKRSLRYKKANMRLAIRG
jgi:hypothetical protein